MKLAHMDVEAVMRSDIDDARAEMQIGVPVVYRQCLKILESEGFAEHDLGIDSVQAA